MSEQPRIGIVADRYELVRALGHGSFGRTFLARDRNDGRDVAIKLLDPRTAEDWKSFDRFEREAAVLRSLRHQGIPEVHALIRDEWQGGEAAFLVMEYIEGTSLDRIIDEGRVLDAADVVALFLEQLGILEYLHGCVPPVLHRDIKPANIIVRNDGRVALVDFGSVRRVFMGPDESGSTIAGTYGYMPYEQYMGQASPTSDLYALAATFLHLLTGRAPREFLTSEGRIEVPDTLPGDARLRPILARMLLPSAAERFQSARDVRQALLSHGALPAVRPMASYAPLTHGPSATPAPLAAAVPRKLAGDLERLLDQVAPTTLQLMDGSAKPEKPGVLDWAMIAFFSLITAGVLPMVFFSMASARRRRLKRFFRDGVATIGEITNIAIEKAAFDSTIARVNYQFEADGRMRRDTDQILPVVAGRWQAGDPVHILYLADQNYDSVIVELAE